MHEGNRIDQPRIGTERFNYDLQRQEILLESGWTAVVPPELTGEGAIGPQARTVIGLDPGRGDHSAFAFRYGAQGAIAKRFDPIAHRAAGGLTFYDVSTDTSRPVTQQEFTDMQKALNRVCQQRDAARAAVTSLGGRICELETYSQTMAVENDRLRSLDLDQLRDENTDLRKRLWLPVEPGEHDYTGPTKPDPDTGRPVPVPDPVHERFHGSIGDVLAGRVIPAARRQMQEALKSAPKEPTTIPTNVQGDDPKRMGCEWLARL